MLFFAEHGASMKQAVTRAIELVGQARPGDARLQMDYLTALKRDAAEHYGLDYAVAADRYAPVFKAELDRLEGRYEEAAANTPKTEPAIVAVDPAFGTVVTFNERDGYTVSDEVGDDEQDEDDTPIGLIQRGFDKLLDEEGLDPSDVDDIDVAFDRDSGELDILVTFKTSRKLVVSLG